MLSKHELAPVVYRYHSIDGTLHEHVMGRAVLESTSTGREQHVSREKPADLFANGTFHRSQTYHSKYEIGSWADGGGVFTGPCSWITPAGPGDGLHERGLLEDWRTCDSRLRSRIKDAKANAAIALAERKQTLSLVSSSIGTILKTYRSFRGGTIFANIIRGVQTPRTVKEKELANRWLEYSFGWKPLMADIYGFTEEINQSLREGFPRYEATSQTVRKGSNSATIGRFGTSFHSFEETVSMRVKARYQVKNAAVKRLSQLGITNPLEVAWELVPFSFVIDWFIPVGDFISSLDALVGVDSLVVQRGVKTTNNWEVYGPGGYGFQRTERKVRLPISTSLALPSVRPSLPGNPFSKLALSVALLRQLSPGKPLPVRGSSR